MGRLNGEHRSYLAKKFGNRVSFDRLERKLYGHDIAVFPSLVKPVIGKAIPEAIVQPESEEELVDLVRWAREESVALTPRGKATSGYGGCCPQREAWSLTSIE